MSANLSLFTLPLEILIRILGLLEGRQIARCGAVSRPQFSLPFILGF
jgi:F-box-like